MPPAGDPYEKADVVVLFRSGLTGDAGDDYGAMAQVMIELASRSPGFVAVRQYTGEGDERLSVVWWEDHQTLAAWRENVEHLAAQKLGRARWYQWFQLEVCDRVRAYGFERDA